MAASETRTGRHTRQDILETALRLFTEKGYEDTSVRDIAQALGITPAALYYHFRSKEDIATGYLQQRRGELDDLIAWVRAQKPSPTLAERSALRWLDHVTAEQLQAMRFAHANAPFLRRIGTRADGIQSGFDRLIDELAAKDAGLQDRLRLAMIFDTLSAAIRAGDRAGAGDDEIIEAARRATIALARARSTD